MSRFGNRSANTAGPSSVDSRAASVSERGPSASRQIHDASRPGSSHVPSTTAPPGASAPTIAAHAPSAARVARLAEVEAFYGACLLLSRDRHAADERFALAKTLDPTLRADAIFPPEVTGALAAARPGPSLALVVDRVQKDARIWIDAGPVEAVPPLAAGLHYVAVERADRKPEGSIVRVSRAVTHVSWTTGPRAAPEQAVVAAAEPRATDAERLDVSGVLRAPLWRVVEAGNDLEASRFDARDVAQPIRSLRVPTIDQEALARAVCGVDDCDAAPVASKVQPVWRRRWFWGVVGAGAVVVIGAVVAGAVVATSPRDYSAVVR